MRDFGDRDEVRRTYARELEELIREVPGAGKVVGFPLANMRFSPRHRGYMDGANSQPAHFPHVDVTPRTSHGLVDTFFGPKEALEPGQVLVGYNIWRDPARHAQPLHNSIDLPADDAAPRVSVEARFFACFE